MTDRGPDDRQWTELAELARTGERYAEPLPVERVRVLGNRRRTRRGAAIVVAAVATVAVIGGTLVNNGGPRTGSPDPAATPTVISTSPAPIRTVGAANLVEVGDLETRGKERYVETATAGDRDRDRITVCVPAGGYAALEDTAIVARSFRLDRREDGSKNPGEPPIGTDPTVLTQAMQFASAGEATHAYQTYRGWLRTCQATIRSAGRFPIRGGRAWYPVKTVAAARSGFAEVFWQSDSGRAGGAYIESVGLVQVDDRLAVTVSLVWGQDYNVAYKLNDDTGLPLHPQFALLVNASHGLLR